LSADFILKADTGGTIVVNAAAVIETPKTGGFVHYDWITGDTATLGTYKAEIEIHWPGSKSQTAPTNSYWTVEIVADLDGAA
jgi:hypothetical protein